MHFDTHEPMKWCFQNSKLKLDVTDDRVIQCRHQDGNKVCQAFIDFGITIFAYVCSCLFMCFFTYCYFCFDLIANLCLGSRIPWGEGRVKTVVQQDT